MYDFETWPERHDTTSVKWKMIETELGVGHEDVLALSVADMEFVTPPAVVEALVDAARNDVFGYDYATDEYLAAVCDWMRRRHGLEADPKLISLSAGVMPAVNTALRAFTHPGDAVIIQRPVYYPFTNAAMNNGLEILNNALLFDGETGRYSMDFEDLERLRPALQGDHAVQSAQPGGPCVDGRGAAYARRHLRGQRCDDSMR